MRRVVWRTTANDLAHRTDFYRRALHQPTTPEQTESAILPTTCAQALRYVWGNESNLSMLHTGITPASNLSVEFDRWRLPANTDVQSLFEAHFRRFTHRLHEAGRCAFRQNDQAHGAWCSGQVPRLGKRYRPDLPCEIRRDVFARY